MELQEELTIRDFLHLVRRRRKEFFVCWAVIFSAVAIYTFSVTPLYRADAYLHVQMSEDNSRTMEGAINLVTSQPTFNVEQLISPQVFEDALARLNPGVRLGRTQLDELTVTFERRVRAQYEDRERQMVSLSVVSPVPVKAMTEANALAHAAVKVVGQDLTAKQHRTKQFVESQLKEVAKKLRDSEDRLRRLRERIDPQSAGSYLIGKLMELRGRRTELLQKYTGSHPTVKQLNAEIRTLEKQVQELPNQEIDIGRITREVRLNEELFTMLAKRLEDANIIESARIAPISIVYEAVEPTLPESPNKKFNLVAGLLIGLLISLIVVLVHQHFDTSMVTPEEIEQFLQLPVLAAISHIERRQTSSNKPAGPVLRKPDPLGEMRSRLILHFPPQSSNAEVHHLLRNNLMKDVQSGHSQIYLFTSAINGEGKSITAANFAIAAAQAGLPTLLVEADLRKPMVSKLFGLPAEPGLTNYFYSSPHWETSIARWEQIARGTAHLGEAINLSGITNLHVLTSGKLPTNPISLFSSDRLKQLMQAMRQRFPLIIMDGAPALLFADSSIMGPLADGVVLVYRFGHTGREVLRRAHNQLISSNAKIIGVVVNDIVQTDVADYGGYYGAYKHYEEEPPAPKPKPE
ncbi:MAG: polysaccharide biosynthesis tyrosine autokinase [Elusimicrobiota bacterium]